MNTHPHRCQGFTLVEVALALGVAAFALVAIIGLLPVGLQSNQSSLERTAAAALAANLVADLRATAVEIPATAQESPRYHIPLPATGNATHTLFLRADGSAAGPINANADPQKDPRYRVTLVISGPTSAAQPTATTVRLWITWPALADQIANTSPAKYSGAYEIITALNRH
jgi:uncharacterized protein (TIGR02598 family)